MGEFGFSETAKIDLPSRENATVSACASLCGASASVFCTACHPGGRFQLLRKAHGVIRLSSRSFSEKRRRKPDILPNSRNKAKDGESLKISI